MFRREWRQQVLVIALLSVAVAAAIGSITIASNSVPADNSDFGSANLLLAFDASDPRKLQAGLDSAKKSFGTIDVIGHRSVRVPGSVETVDYRSQVPGGAYGGELLALRRGSYPVGPGEVAVTDGVAESLRLEIGSDLALDGRRRTVVGIVENPSKLSDEFALVSPSSASPDQVDVLVDASAESTATDSFLIETVSGRVPDQSRSAFAGSMTRGSDVSGAAETLAMFSVATVFLLLASLVAAAGFAVVAQRRLRQLGMLAAVGATEKHLRLVLLTNGAVVGTIAAFIGTIAGLALWVVFAPTLESAVDHRIDRLSLPWALIAMAVVLAVVGATAAAWWPGRTVARLPVVLALSGRPPEPRPARHSAIAAAALIAVGIGCLALSDRDSPPLIIAGLVATILGTLLLGPLAIRLFARAAGHAPIAARLALRDLARYQARSGAALAAITLALGIAAAVVITAAAEEKQEDERAAAGLPNLSDRQIRVYTGPTQRPELIPLPLQTPAPARTECRARPPTRRRSRSGSRDPASEGPPTRRAAHRRMKATGPSSPSVSRGKSTPSVGPGDRVSTSPRLPCSGTSESTPPRSTRARTSWPTRPSPSTSSSSWTSRRGGNSPSRTSSGSTARKSSALGEGTPAACRPRSSPSTVFAATAGSRSRAAGSSSRAAL